MGAAGFGTLASHFTDRTVVTYDPRGVERSEKSDPTHRVDARATRRRPPSAHHGAGRRPGRSLRAAAVAPINALALVAQHPEQVRTLVAHEPPTAAVTSRTASRRSLRAWTSATPTSAAAMGPAMAKFIAIVSHEGPITADYLGQPAPDPAMFGLPTEDDGSRNDRAARAEHRAPAPTTSSTSSPAGRARLAS